jgi:hypothetical protein
MPVMLLDPGLSGTTFLYNVDFNTFAGDETPTVLKLNHP